MKKGFALKSFTFAEVLITLGIIGIVAAMTLPALITKTKEKQTVIQLKKTYSILQNLSLKIRSENGDLNEWADDSIDYFMNETIKHLKIINKCDQANKCSPGMSWVYPAVVLEDGTVVGFSRRNPKVSTGGNFHVCKANLATATRYLHYNSCATVMVDINGKKKPNRLGEDVFEFRFFTDGVLPNGIPNAYNRPNVEAESFDACLKLRGGHGACTAWAVINENLDYLHCPDEINWNKARACKKK